jgi:hypothetical protein
MDCWSDPDLKQYMAVTAHWLESTFDQRRQRNLNLRVDLVGFLLVPGSHTGERLAEEFLFIIDRLDLAHKVYSLCLVFLVKLKY